MAVITFDTPYFVKMMKEGGFSETQAEAVVRMVAQAREVDMQSSATKADLRELEIRLDSKIKDLQIRIGGMIMALGGILTAIKYFG